METQRTKSANEKFCSECGTLIHEKAELCPHCGVRQAPAGVGGPGDNPWGFAPNGRSRIIAALLAVFLGGVGAHKFYLGEIGIGIVFLLFSWTFIPSLVGLVQGLMMFGMSNENFIDKYGQ